MQNYSPATVSVLSGLSYTLLSDIKSTKQLIEDKIFVGNFYTYLAHVDNIHYVSFGFIDHNEQFNDILMVPLTKRVGTHYFDVKKTDINEYLYNFFEHKTEYTFDALLGNKVSGIIKINERIRTYCEMISEDLTSITKLVTKLEFRQPAGM
jgi:hypothetical protein